MSSVESALSVVAPPWDPWRIGPEKLKNLLTTFPRPAFPPFPPPDEPPLKLVTPVSTPVVRLLKKLPTDWILGETTAVISDWKSRIGTGAVMLYSLFFSIFDRSKASTKRVLLSSKVSTF